MLLRNDFYFVQCLYFFSPPFVVCWIRKRGLLMENSLIPWFFPLPPQKSKTMRIIKQRRSNKRVPRKKQEKRNEKKTSRRRRCLYFSLTGAYGPMFGPQVVQTSFSSCAPPPYYPFVTNVTTGREATMPTGGVVETSKRGQRRWGKRPSSFSLPAINSPENEKNIMILLRNL